MQMEPYVAAVVRSRLKCPSGLQSTQRSIRRLDQNAPVGAVERNAACEGFTINPARDRHVGHQDLGLSTRFTRQNGMSDAERHEFMIAFDVGHQIEHLICAVMDAPHRTKNRHFSLRRSILPLGGRTWPNREKASGNRSSDIDLCQLLLEEGHGFWGDAKSPRDGLSFQRCRSQLMQVNIGGRTLRHTVARRGSRGSINRARGGMPSWI